MSDYSVLLDGLESAAPGTHLCGIFDNAQERFQATSEFLAHALKRHHRAICISEGDTHSLLRESLAERGIDSEKALASGQLQFLTHEDAYFKSGGFSSRAMIAFLSSETEKALADGWSALSVCGQMVGVLSRGADPERLFEYENELNSFFPSSRCIGFCMYDRAAVEPWLLLRILRAHPWVFVKGAVCENLGYTGVEQPAAFTPENELTHFMAVLERCRRKHAEAEKELRFIADHVVNDLIYVYQLYPTRGFVYVSPSASRITGYSPEEHYNDPDLGLKLVHPEDQELLKDILRSPNSDPVVLRWIRKNGKTIYTEQRNVPIYDEQNGLVGIQGIARDITDQVLLEQELWARGKEQRTLNAQLNALLEAVPANLTLQSPDLRVLWANRAAAEGLGKKVDELIGEYCHVLWHSRLTPCDPCPVKRCFQTGKVETEVVTTPDGRIWSLRAVPIREKEHVVNVVEFGMDITAQKRAEEHQLHTNKMEAIGRLAGGIAHDFNNMLSVILGFGEDLLERLEATDPRRSDVKEILNAARHAALLTRQLLAFSRKQMFQNEVLNVNDLLRNMENMLRRLLGEDIEFHMILADDMGCVNVDPSQIEQVIMNLAVNAREAMPQGGKLLIETSNVELSGEYVELRPDVAPGSYIMIAVSDTGHGMDKAVQEKIFEPFFSTKEKGRASGLGLSTVYGIVKQSGGHIRVYSEPGHGATFKVYLPRVFAEPTYKAVKEEKATPSLPSEVCILLIEDEPSLRRLFEMGLSEFGYHVTVAESGNQALQLVEREGIKPDIVVTDVVLPGMSGADIVRRLREFLPNLKALFMSGYTDNAIVHHGVVDPGVPFIQKPFTLSEFTAKISEVLKQEKSTSL
ncbi:MAG TPA: MEDS domain-containing protein [Candidatus Hydrogenedentes bacterium]|nr:MEDS domain-containing protein [Candidatus Hydrogenedentota bacterium]HOL77196.1 MEDS domain-containing protein [Candidatus Hydrogenedentota bacterium]HPO85865.1 MEDS domain-containing protein [Candidatus Hydrogenedentota bacterium]